MTRMALDPTKCPFSPALILHFESAAQLTIPDAELLPPGITLLKFLQSQIRR